MWRRRLPSIIGLFLGLVIMRIVRGARAPYIELGAMFLGSIAFYAAIEIWLWRRRMRAPRGLKS